MHRITNDDKTAIPPASKTFFQTLKNPIKRNVYFALGKSLVTKQKYERKQTLFTTTMFVPKISWH